jgi:8-oxo-dGTP pyrophosphatase MutT (NUDIX family)
MVKLPTFTPRHTARGIVVHDGKLLLMERWRGDLHYFSIPGGGIEPGETPELTVVRELIEETTVIVTVDRPVLEMHAGDVIHQVFLCSYVSGEPALLDTAPEAQHGPENRFEPRWVNLGDLPETPFVYWQPLKEKLIAGLRDGFPEAVAIVRVPSAR